MKTEQIRWTESTGWSVERGELQNLGQVQLVVVFGDSNLISNPERYGELRTRYPEAHIVGCSTSGNIIEQSVQDNCIVATAMLFEKSRIRIAKAPIRTPADSEGAGAELVRGLQADDLRHVFLLSDGLNVSGSELANGANRASAGKAQLTGGLAGDGTGFKRTWVMADGAAESGQAVAVGFYGPHIRISHGCVHGWQTFGINRTVTKSQNNVVYEIDGEPALALYKRYLGDEAARELPSSGLRFPLCVQMDGNREPVVRTLLAVDETKQSLTFAGDVPEGKVAMLMKTDINGLIAAAEQAAQNAKLDFQDQGVALAVSCVGRRLVLKKLVEEELEAVQEVLGENVYLSGFYSYGELAPFGDILNCYLHNQTLTLTTIAEG